QEHPRRGGGLAVAGEPPGGAPAGLLHARRLPGVHAGAVPGAVRGVEHTGLIRDSFGYSVMLSRVRSPHPNRVNPQHPDPTRAALRALHQRYAAAWAAALAPASPADGEALAVYVDAFAAGGAFRPPRAGGDGLPVTAVVAALPPA